ncbi:hypothetical protein [Nocardioides jejuensis]|uniref:Uncharacterized protein n=1 Tax=Nocardioides jejuensis TaxID=2502782 RepID=A0A4R1CGS3_9ACTN|nr:hypothetical protein [Nocardioides jejuensis]TCJ30430.1 hypothetical protein EPD65_04320 [Nocardioides jejuensis]
MSEARLGEIAAAHQGGGLVAVSKHAAFEHERSVPVATGRVATVQEIRALRTAVCSAMSHWIERGTLGADAARFDSELGVVLHHELQIVPSDAAHEDTWSFLTLMVFPDLATLRFPGLHKDRMVGTPRNALRRVWQRQEVLGDWLQTADAPLGEDELVGLFERSAMVRNRRLARITAGIVAAHDGANRSAWARNFYKAVTFQTGMRMLDVLDDAALTDLLTQTAAQVTVD